jgi:cyclic pyranopterin phosphate synthase
MPLTHLDKTGNPGMVDVSDKDTTARVAIASAKVILAPEIGKALAEANYQNHKGSIFQTAIIAGTMAVKQTWSVIPLCHAIPVSGCKVTVEPSKDHSTLHLRCRVKTMAPTGVEMEALHGVSVAALTIYDMCKALSHDIRISDIQLESKTGGKSDFHRQEPQP